MSSSVAWREAGSLSADIVAEVGFGGGLGVFYVVVGACLLGSKILDERISQGDVALSSRLLQV